MINLCYPVSYPMNKITNLAGQTFEVGKKVIHSDKWVGTVVSIKKEKCVMLYVQPDNEEELGGHQRWKLKDGSYYCKPLSYGASMGNYAPVK